MITPEKIRAARALKNWSQSELAQRTGLTTPSIANIELGKQKPSAQTVEEIKNSFALVGVAFTDRGVEYVDETVFCVDGIMDNNYHMLVKDAVASIAENEELLFLGADDKRSPDAVVSMFEAFDKQGIKFRKIICSDNVFIQGSPERYRGIPKKYFTFEDVIAIFPDRVIMVIPDSSGAYGKILVLKNKESALSYKRIFEFFWDHGSPLTKYKDVRDYKNPMLDNYTEEELQKM